MSDYGVKPPVMLLGAVRTADDVSVEFKVRWKRP
jgi:hypothetical protein